MLAAEAVRATGQGPSDPHTLTRNGLTRNDHKTPDQGMLPAAAAAQATGQLQGTMPEISSAGEYLRFMVSGARICSIPAVQWSEEFLKNVREAAANDEQYQRAWRP